MGDLLKGITLAMRKIIHRVNAPGITRAVVVGMLDAVENRVAHQHIGVRHVNFRTQYLFTIAVLAGFHFGKQFQILFHAARAVRAILAGLRRRSFHFGNLLAGAVVYIRQSFADQLHGKIIQLREVIGGI